MVALAAIPWRGLAPGAVFRASKVSAIVLTKRKLARVLDVGDRAREPQAYETRDMTPRKSRR